MVEATARYRFVADTWLDIYVESIKNASSTLLPAAFLHFIAPKSAYSLTRSPPAMLPHQLIAVRCANFGRKEKTYEQKTISKRRVAGVVLKP